MAPSERAVTEKLWLRASDAMAARTGLGSRSHASNSRRSKFDDTWMSIEGEEVGTTSRTW